MAGITWLHLSDWHQRGKDFNRYVVGDKLIDDIRKHAEIHTDLAKVDFIIFSGDVAFSGKAEEYQAAIESLFKPVLEVTGLSEDKLFIVPGNHDFDRNEYDFLPIGIRQPFKSDEQVNQWLTDEKKRTFLLSPFNAYRQFVSGYTGQDQPDYTSICRIEVDGKHIALLGLNSALMCRRHIDENGEVDDRGFLMVGEPQLYDPLKQIANAEVRIAVIHHPFDWLTEFDRDHVEDPLKRACHFILCGHLHKPKVTIEQGTAGECVIIPAGALYDKRIPHHPRYTNSYNFVHLDFDTAQGTIYFRRWSEINTEWIPDTESHPPYGFFQFHLPKQGPGPTPRPDTVVPPQNFQINSVNLQQVDPVKLREAMVTAYNLADLQILCANLHVSYEDIGGEAREVKILHLIDYFRRRGWYDKLVRQVLQERPHLFNELTR